MLSTRGRITLHQAPGSWRLDWLQAALEEIVVEGALALAAVQLEAFHADPTDRFIVAAALARGATLLTADRAILAWPGPHPHKSTLTHPLSRLGHGKAPALAGAFLMKSSHQRQRVGPTPCGYRTPPPAIR
jgi:hypothetical protein